MVEQVTERAHQASEVAGQVKTWVCGTGVAFERYRKSERNPIYMIARELSKEGWLLSGCYSSAIKVCVNKNGEIYIVHNTSIEAVHRTMTGQPTISELFLAGLDEEMANKTATEVGEAVASVVLGWRWTRPQLELIKHNFRQLAASYIGRTWEQACFDAILAKFARHVPLF
jgi:hypothetical protein